MKKFFFFALLLSLIPSFVWAEGMPYSEALSGNSFYIIEAYNQERGFVQHTFNTVWYPTKPKDLFLSYSEAWPVPDERNQVGFTFTYTLPDSNASGIDDLYLNYSRQVLFEGKHGVAFAPAISLILPTGSVKKGLGFGTVGLQPLLPVSKRWNEYFVTHFNAGLTFLPKAEVALPDGSLVRHNLTMVNFGGSIVWLIHRRFNFLTEFVGSLGSDISDSRHSNRYSQYILNPGVRFSIPVGRSEIVPAFSLPLSWMKNRYQTGLFFYLSINHPFTKAKEQKPEIKSE